MKFRNVCLCGLLSLCLLTQPLNVLATEGETATTESSESTGSTESTTTDADAEKEAAKKRAEEKKKAADDAAKAAQEQNNSISQQVKDAESNLSNKQNEANAAKDKLNSINSEADKISGNISSLNRNIAGVASEISSTEESISKAEDDIDALEKELEKAKKEEQKTYEILKKRIAFSYENDSKTTIFLTLISSNSLAEFFTRVEYTSSILNYESRLLEECKVKQAEIQKKADELSAKQEELSSYKQTLSAKKDEMNTLVKNANESLTAKQGEASEAAEDVAAYEAELASLRQTYQGLQAQQAQAQASLAQAIAAQEDAQREQLALEQGVPVEQVEIPRENTAGAVSASEYEMLFLAACIQAEADNQGYGGQLAVGSVIMNRVMSDKFAQNSIVEVITAPGQFASYSSGMVNRILERGPNDSCKQAAQAVISGQRSGDWLFFMTPDWADHFGITGYTVIGDHAFFYKWGAN
ncbi:MAG: cell wall hydrolase [Lachnospiraceae bacterium]|nr:cell wall hydrolase [Lachnospiraceae bacterium]